MKLLITLILLTGCATTSVVTISPNKYNVGDCVQLRDPLTGVTSAKHRLLVTKVLDKEYAFRWRFGSSWGCCDSQDIRFGEFKKFEEITFKITCPK